MLRYSLSWLATASIALAQLARDPLSVAECADYRARVIPVDVVPWQTIPWRTDLLAARAEAVRLQRPLFLWTMNGHPLGCT